MAARIGELVVRPARADDRTFIHAAVPRLFEHPSGWRTLEELVAGTIRVLDEALAAGRDDELFVIAQDGAGERLGFAYAVTSRDFFTREAHAHLSEIVVVREGLGAGRALVGAVEAWAFARGDRYVSLNVLDRNTRASEFYARGGYEVETRSMIKLRGSRR